MDNIVTKSVRVGSVGYYVNRDHLVISKPEAGNIADITEQAIAAGKVLKGRNIVLYALAAFMDDEENPGQQRLAPNATLINEGIIEIHLHDISASTLTKRKTWKLPSMGKPCWPERTPRSSTTA